MHYDWEPLLLTFRLAATSTLVLLLAGVPFAYWLATRRWPGRALIEALVSMPLVLPPSVLGFYLLLAFSPQGALGRFVERVFGLQLVFSFEGLVLASVIFSFPFLVRPVQAAFENLPASLKEAAFTLGMPEGEAFFRVLLPNVKPALLAGTVLAFAHTVGEFGVVLMVGGNVPGVTRVASIAIYDEVESLHYGAAGFYSSVLFLVSFAILLTVHWLNRRPARAI